MIKAAFKYAKDFGLYTTSVYPYTGERSKKPKVIKGRIVMIGGLMIGGLRKSFIKPKIKGVKRVKIGGLMYQDNDIDEIELLIRKQRPLLGLVRPTSELESIKGDLAREIYNGSLEMPDRWTYKGERHCVLVVGCGRRGYVPYVIIKNSWGTRWGLHGYARIDRSELYHTLFYPRGPFKITKQIQ